MLCSGIAHGSSFRALADGLGIRVVDEVRFADHHRYSLNDVERLHARAKDLKAELIVTTEKDAGKLGPLLPFGDRAWWAICLGAVVSVGEDRLRRLVMEQPMDRMTGACA